MSSIANTTNTITGRNKVLANFAFLCLCHVYSKMSCVMLLKHTRFVSLSVSDKATHSTNRQEDWEYIIGFCDQINKELEGYVRDFLPNHFS